MHRRHLPADTRTPVPLARRDDGSTIDHASPSESRTHPLYEPVMRRAPQHRVLEARLSTLRPVPHMMRIDEVRVRAAGERAAAVAGPERAFQERRHSAVLATDV